MHDQPHSPFSILDFAKWLTGPARTVLTPVEIAAGCCDRIHSAGVPLWRFRVGHASEIEVKGEDISGIAAHIAARIAALANVGQVMVSRTVRDLVAGSNLRLEAQGAYNLKGLSESMPLFAVTTNLET